MADLNEIGCTDGGCVFRVATGGMRTNGGCRCLPPSLSPDDRVRLRAIAHALCEAVRKRDARIAKLESRRDPARPYCREPETCNGSCRRDPACCE